MKSAQVIRRINFNEWGGTENVVWNSSRCLKRAGEETEILATRALGGDPLETHDGLSVRRFPYFYPYFPLNAATRAVLDKKGGNPFSFAMERYLSRNGFDLIHCHNSGRLAELCARAAERCRIPYLLSMHGGFFDVPANEKEELCRPLKGKLPYGGILERIFRLKRDFIAGASGIICVGENEKEEFERRYPQKRICFLPNGVDPAQIRLKSAFRWKTELALPEDCKILLNVSRIDYQKNQKLLVSFAAELLKRGERIHLLLIGPPTSRWYADELKEQIRSLGLQKHVTMIEGLPPDDERLRAAYQQADAFLMASLHEPFGIVALEAWSAGIPLIAPRVGGLGKLVKDGIDGLLYASNDLNGMLEQWTRLPELRRTLTENATRTVERNYTWDVIAAKLQTFYRETVDDYRKNHPLCR